MDLGVEADALNSCVQCGLCLPHCPTYRVTGDEARSPRGRIALIRQVQDLDAPITKEVKEAFDTCVQCRGCEPACPSSVPYGHMLEQVKEVLADDGHGPPTWMKPALAALEHPKLLELGASAAAIGNRLGVTPQRFGIPANVALRRDPLPITGADVYLFTGCVMNALQRDVHHASLEVIAAAGFGATPTSAVAASGAGASCCGALHTHAGSMDQTRDMAAEVMSALDGARPILVNSAGCGAQLKDYGYLLGTAEAKEFSGRVFDIAEWLAPHVDVIAAKNNAGALPLRVAVQDPCHLRHVQRVHMATRELLAPFVAELIEIDDDGLCCGAGGAFSLQQPELSGAIRERKVAAIDALHPDVVASANPGCAMHLGAVGVRTRHPVSLVAEALRR